MVNFVKQKPCIIWSAISFGLLVHLTTSNNTNVKDLKLHHRKTLSAKYDLLLACLSLDGCFKACVYRKRCQSFTYNRNMHSCSLFVVNTSKASLKDGINGDVFVNKPTNLTVPDDCRVCTVYEVCSPGSDTPCQIKECSEPEVSDSIQLLGNGYAVGRRRRVTCKFGLVLKDHRKSTKCLNTGEWNRSVGAYMFWCMEPILSTDLPMPDITTEGRARNASTEGNTDMYNHEE